MRSIRLSIQDSVTHLPCGDVSTHPVVFNKHEFHPHIGAMREHGLKRKG